MQNTYPIILQDACLWLYDFVLPIWPV